MKKFILFLAVVFMVSCATSKSKGLPTFPVYKQKSGYVILTNQKKIFFNSSEFTANRNLVRIQSQYIKSTIMWININKVVIYNK